MIKRAFKQLTYRDRQIIQFEFRNGTSISKIALKIGKNKSTISRELKRNLCIITAREQIKDHCAFNCLYEDQIDKTYFKDRIFWSAVEAERIKNNRQGSANKIRRGKSKEVQKWVTEKLKTHWSPEQIAGRSKVELNETVSHEYVYSLIKKDKKKGGCLYTFLKRHGRRKQRFNSREYIETIPNRICISQRPKHIDEKTRIGDLEADLIQGYKSDGYILSVIDRHSRRLVLRKIDLLPLANT